MSNRIRASLCTAAATLAAALPFLGIPAAAAAARHHATGHSQASGIHPGLYDCWGYSVYGFIYGGTYQFATPGKYGYAGLRKGHKLLGKVDYGAYVIHGTKLIPTSGPMKQNHFYLVKKNAFEWTLWNDNHKPTGEGCYRYVPKKH